MAGIYGRLNSREDFHRVLDEVTASTREALQQAPNSPPTAAILKQLEALTVWTSNGREPTEEERVRANFGTIAAREYGDATDVETAAWAEDLYCLNNYFQAWPSDAEAANPREDDGLKLLARIRELEERVWASRQR